MKEEEDGHIGKNQKILREKASLSNYGSHVGLKEEHGGGFTQALLIY